MVISVGMSLIFLVVWLVAGQANLLKSSVLVIGAGGLGSPALLYLAACGVGKIRECFKVQIYCSHSSS